MTPFRIEIPLLTPVILPAVCPSLDVLLAEGVRRYRQDWEHIPLIPLMWHESACVFMGSQAVFLEKSSFSVSSGQYTHSTNIRSLDLDLVKAPLKKIAITGGPTTPKFSTYNAVSAAAVVFYGVGDAHSVAKYLGYLGGIGVSRASGMGEWSHDDLMLHESPEYEPKALLRSVSRSFENPAELPYQPIKAHRRLIPWVDQDIPAYAPHRFLKEKRG